MKLIIAGSRHISGCDAEPLISEAVYQSGWPLASITEVVSGAAWGIDAAGEWWAEKCVRIPVRRFEAEWRKHGPAAGPIRNAAMADYADALLAIKPAASENIETRGTDNMIRQATERGLRVVVCIVGRSDGGRWEIVEVRHINQ